jgi:hypothetical protein
MNWGDGGFISFTRCYILIGVVIQLFSLSAVAEDASFFSGLPTHDIYPSASGIIFPSMFTAAGVNPAGLVLNDPENSKGNTGVGLTYSPPINNVQEYSAVFATQQKNYGLSVGYDGSFDGAATHSVYAGAAFRAESATIGVGLRDPNLAQNQAPSTDLGFIAQTGNPNLKLGLVLYHINDAPQPDIGIGFGNQKDYNFEINLLMPTVNSLFNSNSTYVITAATTVYASIFGLSFKTSYSTNSIPRVTQSAAVLLRLWRSFSLTVQYDSPNRTYYGAIILF